MNATGCEISVDAWFIDVLSSIFRDLRPLNFRRQKRILIPLGRTLSGLTAAAKGLAKPARDVMSPWRRRLVGVTILSYYKYRNSFFPACFSRPIYLLIPNLPYTSFKPAAACHLPSLFVPDFYLPRPPSNNQTWPLCLDLRHVYGQPPR
jgi:hypothetical protein